MVVKKNCYVFCAVVTKNGIFCCVCACVVCGQWQDKYSHRDQLQADKGTLQSAPTGHQLVSAVYLLRRSIHIISQQSYIFTALFIALDFNITD